MMRKTSVCLFFLSITKEFSDWSGKVVTATVGHLKTNLDQSHQHETTCTSVKLCIVSNGTYEDGVHGKVGDAGAGDPAGNTRKTGNGDVYVGSGRKRVEGSRFYAAQNCEAKHMSTNL